MKWMNVETSNPLKHALTIFLASFINTRNILIHRTEIFLFLTISNDILGSLDYPESRLWFCFCCRIEIDLSIFGRLAPPRVKSQRIKMKDATGAAHLSILSNADDGLVANICALS